MSLFSGLNTASNPPPPPPAEPSSELPGLLGDDVSGGAEGGGTLFSGLNAGSAFNFIGGDQAAPSASDGALGPAFFFIGDDSAGAGVDDASQSRNSEMTGSAEPSGGASAFNFISDEPAGALGSDAGGASAFSFMNSGSDPAPAASTGMDSMFSFLNSAESSSAAPPPASPPEASFSSQTTLPSIFSTASEAPPPPMITSLPAVSEPAAPRKKTRKAKLPGHAASAETDASAAEVPPVAVEPASPAPASELPPPSALAELTSASEPAPSLAPPAPVEQAASHAAEISSALTDEDTAVRVRALRTLARQEKEAPAMPATSPQPVERQSRPPPPPPPPQHAAAAPVAAAPAAAPATNLQTSAGTSASFQPPRRAAPAPPVIQEPPPPPAEVTLEDIVSLEGVQQWLEKKMAASMDGQRALLEQQAACLARNQHTASEITSLRQQLSSTETEQNDLCDSEKFEEAEALESTIQEVKDLITARLEDVAGTSREMASLARKLLEITTDRETLAEKVVDRIQTLQTESEEAMSDMEERSERRLKAETARLESERKRMELACSHLEKDSSNLAEERHQLTEAIDQQTTIHTEERDRAMEQRGTLDLEIRELQQTLQAKMSQRQTLSEVVDSCDIRIASIKSKFEKQLSRLEAKQKRLEEAQREVQQDEKQVEQMAEELQRERKVCMESASQRKRQISEIQCESKRLRKLRNFMARHLRMRSMWQKLMEPHLEMLNKARSRWETVTSESSKLAASLASREAEGGKLRSQLDAIRLQMPSLEAEKKVAVASRSFKEAGRIAEEIKRREEDRKSFEAELENFGNELTGMREQLASCRQCEEGAQAELMETEAKCGAEELRILQRQILDLEALRKKAPVSNTERQLLEKEEAVFRSAQKHLAEKHGIDLSTLEEIPPEDLADFQDGGSEASTKDDGAASEDEAATSSGREPSTAVAGMPRSPTQPLAHADMEGAADVDGTATAEASAVPKDFDAMRRRHADLLQTEAECEEQQSVLEKGIDEACETEDFEKAEELEEERKRVDQALLEARAERNAIEAQLEAEFGADWKDADVKAAAAEEAEDSAEPPAEAAADVLEAAPTEAVETLPEEAAEAGESAEPSAVETLPAESAEQSAVETLPAEAAEACESAEPGEVAEACEAAEPAQPVPAEAAVTLAEAVTSDAAEDGAVATETLEGEPAASGFSFISATSESQEVSNFVAVEAAGAEEEVPAASASSFSFIADSGAAAGGTPSTNESAEATPSSFSFITSSEATAELSETAAADASPPPAPPPPPGAPDDSPASDETF